MQLREKQKIRRVYSGLERQFQGYFEEASSSPGVTGENLLRKLELRFDNVVYRMGFAVSRAEARQMVGHAHFAVNGRVASISSMQLKAGDKIEVRETHRSREPFKEAVEAMKSRQVPEWLSVDAAKLAGSVLSAPRRDQMPLDLNEQLVVEYYSRYRTQMIELESPQIAPVEELGSYAKYEASPLPVCYTHLRAHETRHDLVCRLVLE